MGLDSSFLKANPTIVGFRKPQACLFKKETEMKKQILIGSVTLSVLVALEPPTVANLRNADFSLMLITSGWRQHQKRASPKSGRRFPAPLIAETRRRIAGNRPAMAESGDVERKTGNFALARTTFLQTLEADGITEAHEVRAHIAREQHSSRAP